MNQISKNDVMNFINNNKNVMILVLSYDELKLVQFSDSEQFTKLMFDQFEQNETHFEKIDFNTLLEYFENEVNNTRNQREILNDLKNKEILVIHSDDPVIEGDRSSCDVMFIKM